jgi:hypothetical protein
MNPRDHPRRWGRIVAAVLALVSAWILLVPVTAVYVSREADLAPHDISSLYSWWTTEQSFVYIDATGADLANIGPDYAARRGLSEGIRMNCGAAFTTGPNEQARRTGPQACAELEGPRRIVGLVLLGLAAAALVLAQRLPTESERHRNRYHQSWRHRRRLMRGR